MLYLHILRVYLVYLDHKLLTLFPTVVLNYCMFCCCIFDSRSNSIMLAQTFVKFHVQGLVGQNQKFYYGKNEGFENSCSLNGG